MLLDWDVLPFTVQITAIMDQKSRDIITAGHTRHRDICKYHFVLSMKWTIPVHVRPCVLILTWNVHSVGTPSMIDPQYNMLYSGSKWIFHTICRGAVGCDWGTASVYSGSSSVCLFPENVLSLPWGPSTNIELFNDVKNITRRTQK